MTHMDRRTLLGSLGAGIGLTLTAGCVGGPNSTPETTIASSEQVSTTEFDQVTTTEIDEDAIAVVTEVPDENTVYIYRTLQLPTPSHVPSHAVNFDEASSEVKLTFDSESESEGDLRERSVIQPAPYAVKIEFDPLYENITIAISTLNGTTIRYRTKNTQTTTHIDNPSPE